MSVIRIAGLGTAALLALACGGDGDDAGPEGTPQAGQGGEASGSAGSAGPGGSGGASGGAAGHAAGGGASGTSGSSGTSGASAADGAGCGFSNHASGSRVRLKIVVTDEGDRAWMAGYHDLELGIDCQFASFGPDDVRCLPQPVHQVFEANSSTRFADAACTDAVYPLDPACPSELLQRVEPRTDTCALPVSRLFARGEPFAPVLTGPPFPTALYWSRVGDECRPAEPDADAAYYRLGAEQDFAGYAKASRGTWSNGGDLGITGYVGEDGSRAAQTFVDVARDRACRVQELSDGAEHCAIQGDDLGGYADAACSSPVVAVRGCSAAAPDYVTAPAPDSCTGDSLLRVIAPFTGTLHRGSPDSCSEDAATPSMDAPTYYATEPGDAALAIEVERVVDEADPGRLKPMHFRTQAGGCAFDLHYDTELAMRCAFRRAADGELRCIPEPLELQPVLHLFTDAGCTTAVSMLGLPACAPEPEPLAIEYMAAEGCGEGHTLVYEVDPAPLTPAEAGPLYRLSPQGACQEITPSERYHRVGPELAPERMVRGAPQIE